MRQLGYPDTAPLAYSLVGQSSELDNAMLGFMRSLDGHREWSNHDNQMVAHFDCYMYSKVFADQKGARAEARTLRSYRGSDTAAVDFSRDCPKVDSVVFELGGADPDAAFCGTHVTAQVGLHEAADSHGAVVELQKAGPIFAPDNAYVAPGASEAGFTVSIAPVSSEQTISINATRIDPAWASLRVRPPQMSMIRAQRRQVGGYLDVLDGDAVLGGTALLSQARLDCSNPAESDEVVFDACPLPFGPCTTEKTLATQGTATYDRTLDLPHVPFDTLYRVRGTFLATDASIGITVLSSRVIDITLDRSSASVGLSSQGVSAKLTLYDAPAAPEKVFLRYAHGLSGPSSVVVPAGQSELSFSIQAQGSLLANQCVATVGWVEAISERDAPAAGMNTGRERYAEIVLEQAEGISGCIEMMSPDPRLEDALRVMAEGPIPFPPILFAPDDGVIRPLD